MPGMLNFSTHEYQVFLLILIRISIVIFLFPIFGSRLLPNMAKAGFAMVLALILMPILQGDIGIFPKTPYDVMILIGSEIIIGLILGLTVRMFFGAVQLAGQLISFQMGFSVINVIDPQTGDQVSILDQFGYWTVVLVFLVLNGHHIFIDALVKSFHIVRIGDVSLSRGLFQQILFLSSQMFVLAIKVGAPGIVSLLFVSAAFGLCAKFAPQMNILIAAFPVKIIVGLIFFGITLQIIVITSRQYLAEFGLILLGILRQLGGA